MNLEPLALRLIFGAGPFDLQQYNVELRKGKTAADLVEATRKAMSQPPFKTEAHISMLEIYLSRVVKPLTKEHA